MNIDLPELTNASLEPPHALDGPLDSDPQEAQIPYESETETGVRWNGHYITPDASFIKIENLALNPDPETKEQVQNLMDRFVQAKTNGISEENRLLLLRDVEVLSGLNQFEQGPKKYNIECDCKKGWLGDLAAKVGNFVKNHQVALLSGIMFVSAIVTAIAKRATRGLDTDPTPQSSRPCVFKTEGIIDSHYRIGGINGMNNPYEEVAEHAAYLSGLSQNHCVEWVYNPPTDFANDLVELMTNYSGQSRVIGELLKNNWTAFHEQNSDHPNAKYLQFCHSQGALHVRNALNTVPPEIRNRIIVVAIAPAAIVPHDVCYRSFNYASKHDVVPYGELAYAGALEDDDYDGKASLIDLAWQHLEELIMLDPHPNASIFDHHFKSPTFEDIIKDHLAEYFDHQGKYN